LIALCPLLGLFMPREICFMDGKYFSCPSHHIMITIFWWPFYSSFIFTMNDASIFKRVIQAPGLF